MSDETQASDVSRSPVDPRDSVLEVKAAHDAPGSLDLWPVGWGQPPWTQTGESCTSFVVGAAAYWTQFKQTGKDPGTPSFPFLYNNQFWLNSRGVKLIKALADGDKASMKMTFHIRAACRSASAFGVWFDAAGGQPHKAEFSWKNAPEFSDFVAARKHLFSFHSLFPSVQVDPNDPRAQAIAAAPDSCAVVKSCMLHHGPVAIGINQYARLPANPAGDYPPLTKERQSIGGHAVLLTGYDDEKRRFIYRNSMGPKWGTNGYGTLPYAWVDDDDATYDFYALTPCDGTRRPRVMFHGVTVENKRAEPVHVRIDAYDGVRYYLGAATLSVDAGKTGQVTPVRWMDTHLITVTVAADEALTNVISRQDLICDDPDGRSAGSAHVTVQAAGASDVGGTLLCHCGKPVATAVRSVS